ncbi:hypothetical protein LIER_43841 [Lithospermum erythrorhizon]|uniref:Uncharacterized protein n=1 Tax=Lithospermum erythrorhizon TaxID=34254 RepID=A0AAV3R1G8_LITER
MSSRTNVLCLIYHLVFPTSWQEDIIKKLLPILNPQSCRKMLKMMILDDHISVRKMPQKTSVEPPSILCSKLGSSLEKSTIVCREHFFANPSSTMLM